MVRSIARDNFHIPMDHFQSSRLLDRSTTRDNVLSFDQATGQISQERAVDDKSELGLSFEDWMDAVQNFKSLNITHGSPVWNQTTCDFYDSFTAELTRRYFALAPDSRKAMRRTYMLMDQWHRKSVEGSGLVDPAFFDEAQFAEFKSTLEASKLVEMDRALAEARSIAGAAKKGAGGGAGAGGSPSSNGRYHPYQPPTQTPRSTGASFRCIRCGKGTHGDFASCTAIKTPAGQPLLKVVGRNLQLGDKGICRLYQSGECSFDPCRFEHVCTYCRVEKQHGCLACKA